MFMGQEIPKSAVAAGGVYNYKDGRTAPDTINVLLEYPDGIHRDVRSHAGARHHRRGRRDVRHRGPALHRPRAATNFIPVGKNAAAGRGAGRAARHDHRPHQQLSRLRPLAQAAQRRRAHRPPLGAGLAPGQSSPTCRSAASISTRSAKRFCRSSLSPKSGCAVRCYTESLVLLD